MSQEKLKIILMQTFGGQTECLMGNVQMENLTIFCEENDRDKRNEVLIMCSF